MVKIFLMLLPWAKMGDRSCFLNKYVFLPAYILRKKNQTLIFTKKITKNEKPIIFIDRLNGLFTNLCHSGKP